MWQEMEEWKIKLFLTAKKNIVLTFSGILAQKTYK